MNSVCIINWNWLEILQKSVDILEKEKAEIIILDNGSQDGSGEWMAKQEGMTAILLNENKGSSIGRNMMLKKAKGDYVLLLDSDILYIQGSLEYLVQRIEECPPEIGAIGFNPWLCVNDTQEHYLPASDALLYIDDKLRFAPTHYGLFKREVFDKCSFDENFGVGWGGEDDDLYRQMCQRGYDVRFIDHAFYHAKGTEKWREQHSKVEDTITRRRDYLGERWK